MLNFPEGYTDAHGVVLTDAIGFVTDVSYGVHRNSFSTFIGGAYDYDHRTNDSASLSFRVGYFLNQQAMVEGKKPLFLSINGQEYFSPPAPVAGMTNDELISACEKHILGLLE